MCRSPQWMTNTLSSPREELHTHYDLSTCRQLWSGVAGGMTRGETTGEALGAACKPGQAWKQERRNWFLPNGSWRFPSHDYVFRLGVCKGFRAKRLTCGQILHVDKRVLFFYAFLLCGLQNPVMLTTLCSTLSINDTI